MNSKELRHLRQTVGDDVLRGFMAECARGVRNAETFAANLRAARQAAQQRGIKLPPPLLDAFTMLLVAQECVEEEIANHGMSMEAALGCLNPMLQATSDTWMRVGWEGETP